MNPHPAPLRSLVALGAGLALTLVACSGGDDAADTTSATSTAAPATTGAPSTTDVADTVEATADATAPAGDNAITIADFSFSGVTEVAVGTTIVVTNTDSAVHTFTAEDGTFDSGSLQQGDTFEFTFDTPGEFAYVCNIHPSMKGTITVTG